MDFEPSTRARRLGAEVAEFMRERVIPSEPLFERQLAESGEPHRLPAVAEELKEEARSRGLWNLFLRPGTEWSEGLDVLDYAPLAELMGRSPIGPEVFNCSPPDTGNMELLAMFGTAAQKDRWLVPLLEGRARSTFMMTEPAVASSDATNVECTIEAAQDGWRVDGRKWWASGAGDPRCEVAIVMGKSDPGAARHRQQSMVLVPIGSTGLEIVRDLLVFGYNDRESHCEVRLDGVRVPAANLLGERGAGFEMAQARLGPGRIHHCMRSIGIAERALEAMCARARGRIAFGGPLADQGVVQEAIAASRIEIDQARLATLHAAWLIDREGDRAARGAVAAVKVAVPAMAARVIDRAMQIHGGAGVSQDFFLAQAYAHQRTLRILDGPDEVHRRTVARLELARSDLER